MPNGEPFKEYLILPTQIDIDQNWIIELMGYSIAITAVIAILISIIGTFLDASLYRKIKNKPLLKILETW
jgi:hypothetical protein